MSRQEPEWRVEDVALLEAARERAADIGPHGQPMTEALDSDTDPNNPASPYIYEPYYYVDHAAETLEIAQNRLTADGGENALKHKVWGLKKVPRPPVPAGGG